MSDVDQEQALRDLLEKVPAPPSGITIDWVLPAGRRARRRRWAVWAAGTSVVLTVGALAAVVPGLVRRNAAPVVSPSRTPSDCRVQPLPVPAGFEPAKSLTPSAVDPTGRFIVGSTSAVSPRSVLWADGKPVAWPGVATAIRATDVNSSAVVVGVTHEVSDAGAKDVVTRLTSDFDAGGAFSGVTGETLDPKASLASRPVINAAGDVLFDISRGGETTVMLWPAGRTTAVQVPLPAKAVGADLADDGSIVGAVRGRATESVPYIWDRNGNGRRLSVPAGTWSIAQAIRGDWVVGAVDTPTDSVRPAVWNLRTGEVIEIPGPVAQGANAVNASGWFVAAPEAVYAGAKRIPLPNTTLAGSYTGVSDTGLVVGTTPDGPAAWQC